MKIIEHPSMFRDGVRVVMLSARYKDGCEKKRNILRVSNNQDQFERYVDELRAIALSGERIYSSVSSRSIEKAARLFRERQLQSEYDENPLAFYENLATRWTSCLGSKRVRDHKLWLLDCDSADDRQIVNQCIDALTTSLDFRYEYETKSGWHIVVEPFNLDGVGAVVMNRLDQNGMMLVGY